MFTELCHVFSLFSFFLLLMAMLMSKDDDCNISDGNFYLQVLLSPPLIRRHFLLTTASLVVLLVLVVFESSSLFDLRAKREEFVCLWEGFDNGISCYGGDYIEHKSLGLVRLRAEK